MKTKTTFSNVGNKIIFVGSTEKCTYFCYGFVLLFQLHW